MTYCWNGRSTTASAFSGRASSGRRTPPFPSMAARSPIRSSCSSWKRCRSRRSSASRFSTASAAALHGGAAIGGAINIVLRRDVQGIEAQTTFHRPTDPGGDGEHASALWGGPLGDGHLLIGVDVFRRAEVRRADRDCSRAASTPGGSFADTVGVSENGNTVCIPTVSRGGNGNPIQNVANATGLSIACSLGDCRGSSYTGERKADGLDLRARAEWDIDWAALALAPPLAAPQPLRGVDGRREGPGRPPARPGPRVASREPGRPDCTVEPARDLRLREHAGDRAATRRGWATT